MEHVQSWVYYLHSKTWSSICLSYPSCSRRSLGGDQPRSLTFTINLQVMLILPQRCLPNSSPLLYPYCHSLGSGPTWGQQSPPLFSLPPVLCPPNGPSAVLWCDLSQTVQCNSWAGEPDRLGPTFAQLLTSCETSGDWLNPSSYRFFLFVKRAQ